MGEIFPSFARKFWPQALAGALMAAPTYFNFTHLMSGLIFFVCGGLGVIGLAYEVYTEVRPRSEKGKHPIARMLGIVLGAVLLLFVALFFWPHREVTTEEIDANNKQRPHAIGIEISASCTSSFLSSVNFPKSGEINVIDISQPTEQYGGSGFAFLRGPAESKSGFPPNTWGVECIITNDSDNSIFNIYIPLDLTFSKATPAPGQPPGSLQKGQLVATSIWTIPIERLPGGGEQFRFFIRNLTKEVITIGLPQFITLVSEHMNIRTELIQMTSAIYLWPNRDK
jgi:hypothetical protein